MATRDLEAARKAYELQDMEASKAAHQRKKGAAKERHKTGGDFLKSFVFGSLDGVITTFSIVCGAVGAELSPAAVIILGLSNVLGDGISMAMGDYLSTKSEIDFSKAERKREQWEVENNPEGEKLEMEELYISKGISKEDAQILSHTLAKSKKVWVDVMMVEELGILEEDASPFKNALVTFFAFIILGMIPIWPFIFGHIAGQNIWVLFYIALGLTAITLFFLGAIKKKFSDRKMIVLGFETLFIGGIAAGVAFVIGYVLEPLAA